MATPSPAILLNKPTQMGTAMETTSLVQVEISSPKIRPNGQIQMEMDMATMMN